MMENIDPEFDEIEGIVFISFPSKLALKAHEEVAKSSNLEKDPKTLRKMACVCALEEERHKKGKSVVSKLLFLLFQRSS